MVDLKLAEEIGIGSSRVGTTAKKGIYAWSCELDMKRQKETASKNARQQQNYAVPQYVHGPIDSNSEILDHDCQPSVTDWT
jgi:hypothetical protein